MSSMSHAFPISSSVMEKPMFRICSMTNSFFIIVSNSSLSRSSFPSASAFLKASSRKLMNSLALCSASLTSCSFRSVVAATMLSEATAVSTDIIVHETKTMKPTKKSDQAGLERTRGPAMFIQSSCVLTWKSVKREVATSWKCSCNSCSSSSAASNASPVPSSRVRMIAKQTMSKMRKVKIKIILPNISTSACVKAMSFGKSFTTRTIRSNRSSRTTLTRGLDVALSLLVMQASTNKGSIQESKTPRDTITRSSTAHPVSFAKKPTTPR
mmetsp:Transcript_81345/g.188959  ORF Transcript_81345/g.188959 Transcript_81345/m.188959 type:complete len:269 (-) Transcript_81345:488-1294(-)